MIVVTGGLGYIGSHVARKFLLEGEDVAIIDNASRFSERYNRVLAQLKKIGFKEENLFNIDLTNYFDVDETFKHLVMLNNVDAVCHLAGLISVKESFDKPKEYYENNVEVSQNLFCIMKKYKIMNLLFSSTAAVYGNGETDQNISLDQLKPINPYGRTKLLIEKELKNNYSDFNTVIFRFFNAAGASEDHSIGEMHENESHLIPIIIKTFRENLYDKKNSSFKIFGNDYATPDGTCIRDYIHVEDIADYFYAHYKEGKYGTYNLGTTNGYSVMDIVLKIEEITGEAANFDYAPRREGDPAKLTPKNTDTILNRPLKDLDKIIRSAWNWETRDLKED